MIRLVRVELLRLRWRRAVLLLLAGCVVLPAIVFGATAWNTRPISADDRRAAQEQADRDIASGGYDRGLRQCLRRPDRFGLDEASPDLQAACEEAVLPRPEYYLYREPLSLRAEREDGSGVAVAVVLCLLVLLAGATFVGHDWTSGSMSNQLLFEPRRSRVWLAKALAVVAMSVGTALAVLVAYWSGLWVLASVRDVPIGPTDVEAAYKQAVLGAVLAGGSGLAGYGLTMLFRSTVATLGVLFAVAVGGALVLAALGLGGHPGLQPQANALAWLVGSFSSVDYSSPGCSGSPDGCTTLLTRADSVPYLAVLVLVATVPSLLSFRRRDVA